MKKFIALVLCLVLIPSSAGANPLIYLIGALGPSLIQSGDRRRAERRYDRQYNQYMEYQGGGTYSTGSYGYQQQGYYPQQYQRPVTSFGYQSQCYQQPVQYVQPDVQYQPPPRQLIRRTTTWSDGHKTYDYIER